MATIPVTVLYEDKMCPGKNGEFPLHDLILSMVRDSLNKEVHELKRKVHANPRNGVDNLIKDLERTSLIAAQGWLCVL